MRFAIAHGIGPDDHGTALASLGVRRLLTVLTVVLRLSSAVVAAAVAVAAMAPPASPDRVLVAVAGALLWSLLFAGRMLHRGPGPLVAGIDLLIVADVVFAMTLLVAYPQLVSAPVLSASAGTGWVDAVAGSGVLIAQFGLRQPVGLAAGLMISTAYALGDGRLRDAPVHLAAQALIGAGLVVLLHRAAAAADTALAEEATTRSAAIVRAAVRADERDQQRHLHDTVLATLTMVHTGGIASDSVALRERASEDLAIIAQLGAHPANGRGPGRPRIRLDLVIEGTTSRPRPGDPPLDLQVDIAPVELPPDVAVAMSQCVAEALTNVARHAGAGEARVAGHADADGVSLTVTDDGPGFNTTTVPPHRRGLRESIDGRMRAVGGSAQVRSSPGAGTEVALRWPGE
jgi:signal transduction histidine kinase